MHRKVDPERYRESLARLQGVFAGISETVAKVSRWRCPYKDAENRCTAELRCRNQVYVGQEEAQEVRCAGDNLKFEALGKE